MERYIGRPLSSYECVHHKDGNKLNNSLSNLEVMSRSEHQKHHMALHPGERVITKNGIVRLKCFVDGQKRYYYRHKERLLSHNRAYYWKTRGKQLKRSRTYYLKNREVVLAKGKEWRKKQGKEYDRKRYLRRKLSKTIRVS